MQGEGLARDGEVEAMRLHGYFRSSAAYRVRIALNLKGIAPEHVPVHLRKGEQKLSAYKRLAPTGLVPLWEEPDFVLGQSLAIIEHLDDLVPDPALLPPEPRARAKAREIALTIACDIHPLANLRVLEHLTATNAADERARYAWVRHWLHDGLASLDQLVARTRGRYAVGDEISVADICLVPQLFNARRFDVVLSAYSNLMAVEAACGDVPAFADAAPHRQPDAE